MAFNERLKELRLACGMSQQKLAELSGLSMRTIYGYESGNHNPGSYEVVQKLANALGVNISDLMEEVDCIILDAKTRGGKNAARDMRLLVKKISAMFAGGDLADEDKDAAIRALTDAYWIAKDESKKYIPKKYRKDKSGVTANE